MVGFVLSCSLYVRARTNGVKHKKKHSIKLKEIHSKFIYQMSPMLMHMDRATGVEIWVTTFWSS